jgi:8-oxo-dGTP diphosphatase
MKNKQVGVGIGLIVVRDGKVLLGKRKGSHAAGLYSFPGGHLDWNETWQNCALRELKEECGENIKVRLRNRYEPNCIDWFTTNDIMPQYDKHYITIFLVAEWLEGEAENTEPHKCEGWEWISYEQLANLSQHKQCANWIPMEHITKFRQVIGLT